MLPVLLSIGATSLRPQTRWCLTHDFMFFCLRGGGWQCCNGSNNSQGSATACLLPGIGGWQEMLSGRFQDALVLSHASVGIYHPIKEKCGHPAVTLK